VDMHGKGNDSFPCDPIPKNKVRSFTQRNGHIHGITIMRFRPANIRVVATAASTATCAAS